ncbi:MAG: flagellar basal body-associated FliL family protein [Oligoflexia bacterium]|nr:flagellar basal body-associated FliL family protein [Oligoflexia bacterium]
MAEEKNAKKGAKEEAKGDAGAKDAQAAEAAPVASGSKKKILIVAGIVGVLLLIGTPIAFFTLKGKAAPTEELASNAAESDTPGESLEGSLDEDEHDEGEEALGALYPLESFVVNLEGGRYIRAQVQLEFHERDVPQRFYSRAVPIRDALIKLLGTQSADGLLSEKGREELKTSIKDIVNEVLKKEEVKNVYFTQFVVQ